MFVLSFKIEQALYLLVKFNKVIQLLHGNFINQLFIKHLIITQYAAKVNVKQVAAKRTEVEKYISVLKS